MNKPLNIQVFEHQRLTLNNTFKPKHLKALLKLNEYHNFKYFEAIPDGIKFNQYVGIIQIDGLQIEILPKADKHDSNSKWQGVLIHMLKACGRIKTTSTGTANVSKQNLNLLEIYFELYLNEIDKLLRLGLIKQYRTKTANVKSLKGKLGFAGNIKRNIIHKERFYTTHQVYDKDHKLHQVLAVANNIVKQFTKGTRLSNLSSRIDLAFPEVQTITVSKKTLDTIKLNRKSTSYTYALELARLIILNYSPDIKGGNEKMLSLLFNMNQLWEEYVIVKLRKHIDKNNLNWQIIGQDSKSFINNHYLKPDIILQKDEEIIVIDTKWKLGNEYISVQDLRQVYTYAKYWEANKVMLLYPGNHSSSNFDVYYDGDNKHYCKTGFVSVVNNDNQLNEYLAAHIFELLNINK